MASIGFIGAGKMASALIESFRKAELAEWVMASCRNDQKLERLKKNAFIHATKDNKEVIRKCDIVFLCVKPSDMDAVLDEIKDTVNENQIIISIAAGIRLDRLESGLKGKKVIRVMSNISCLVGEMAAGYSIGSHVTSRDAKGIDKLLNSAGKAVLLKEKYLDAVTALSGSGPAFFAAFIEAMAEGAVKEGLAHDTALELASQTALGAGKLLAEIGMTPRQLIEMVASPGGTTEEGLKILEEHNIKDIIIKAVQAAAKKSRELGEIK